jgi:hypothetical protein
MDWTGVQVTLWQLSQEKSLIAKRFEVKGNSGHGPVAELVGIEGGVVSGVFKLESSDVGASERPRHEERYHEV